MHSQIKTVILSEKYLSLFSIMLCFQSIIKVYFIKTLFGALVLNSNRYYDRII